MFEQDSKKSQKSKRQGEYGMAKGADSVYGELKLSDQLQLEIYTLREDRENLREQIESLTLQNKELSKTIKDL